MLPPGREIPGEGRRDLLLAEFVGLFGAGKQPAPVHPAAEIGGDRDVGRCGDDALRQRRVAARQLAQHQAETLLSRHPRRRRERQAVRHRDLRRLQPPPSLACERHIGEELLQHRRRQIQSLELVPLMPRTNLLRRAPGFHLADGHQAGMVVLVALERQADALDSVGDETDRPIVVDGLEGIDQRLHIMAAEVRHQRQQFGVGALLDQTRHRPLVADIVQQVLAESRAALERQGRIHLVGAPVDPFAQRFAAGLGECLAHQLAILDDDDVPAEVAEHHFELFPQAFAHHGVQTLAVVVNHPPGVAQALLPTLRQRLEDIALVHLGIADQRDHPAFGAILHPAVGGDVGLHQ